jgi:hypothetical protein
MTGIHLSPEWTDGGTNSVCIICELADAVKQDGVIIASPALQMNHHSASPVYQTATIIEMAVKKGCYSGGDATCIIYATLY